MEVDSETGKKGHVISSGYTVNLDILHAFDSIVTKSKNGALKLAAEGDPGYNPVAYVRISDIIYGKNPTENYEV